MIHNVEHDYYMWLRQLVAYRPLRDFPYNKLLGWLYSREFIYEYDMDSNRAADGIALRYKYCDAVAKTEEERVQLYSTIDSTFGRNPCTILEMMIGLAHRHDKRYSEKLDIKGLFWFMIESLRLSSERDDSINYRYVEKRITDFLEHRYSRDGYGGLFYVPSTKQNMRELDIWYQAMAYYNTLPEIKEDYMAD